MFSQFFLKRSANFLFFSVSFKIINRHALFLKGKGRPADGMAHPPAGSLTEIVLLNEEDQALSSWTLYGKTGMVIGRDSGENQVNINLANSTYAGTVDVEHAVLNYSAGSWYVEDLNSKNGVSVQKGDKRKYKLAPGHPCLLARGDILYIGLVRLMIR